MDYLICDSLSQVLMGTLGEIQALLSPGLSGPGSTVVTAASDAATSSPERQMSLASALLLSSSKQNQSKDRHGPLIQTVLLMSGDTDKLLASPTCGEFQQHFNDLAEAFLEQIGTVPRLLTHPELQVTCIILALMFSFTIFCLAGSGMISRFCLSPDKLLYSTQKDCP